MTDEYEAMFEGIEPLEETLPYLRSEGFDKKEVTLYQQDWTVNPLTGERRQMVRCICSGCRTEYFADKAGCGICHNAYTTAPFGFYDVNGEGVISGMNYLCPYCGAKTDAVYSGRMSADEHRHIESRYITEVRKIEGKLCLVEWYIAKRCDKYGRSRIDMKPRKAFAVEEKTLVRMSAETVFYGSVRYEKGLKHRKQYLDDMGEVQYTVPFDPAILVGTSAENSKLDLYIVAAKDQCYPVSYLRVWQKHKNIENLLTAGAGKLVADLLAEEWELRSGYTRRCCRQQLRLEDIDFRQVRPSRMLGLTVTELRMAVSKGWRKKHLRAYRLLVGLGEPFDIERDLEPVIEHMGDFKEIQLREKSVLKVLRYLKKQECSWRYLKDYRDLAQRAGAELTEERLSFPKDLRREHDRLVELVKYKASRKQRESFLAVYEKYEKLQWSDGELCIKLPSDPDELIREGNVLRHCVGGYIDTHIKGKLILFVRHYRRPERSYYTLNIDMTGERPRRVQLHGYGNERHGIHKEYTHTIPKKVTDFVARWEQEVLLPQFKRLSKQKGA